jgi:hypothetical protein
MVPNLAIADSQLGTELHLCAVVAHGLVVEHSIDNPFFVIGVIDDHPHPLADSCDFIWEFDLDVITVPVNRLTLALMSPWQPAPRYLAAVLS